MILSVVYIVSYYYNGFKLYANFSCLTDCVYFLNSMLNCRYFGLDKVLTFLSDELPDLNNCTK